MTGMTKFGNANLPADVDLGNALMSLGDEIGVGGNVIIKMDKTGHWVYGADQTLIDPDGRWAVNPASFVKGWVAWGEGEVLAERIFSAYDKAAPRTVDQLDAPPVAAKRGWEQQLGLSMKCLSGDDEGIEARFATTSAGGKRAVAELGVNVGKRINTQSPATVAVCKLGSSTYQHKTYGRIFYPVFEIIDWMTMDGEPVEEAASAGDTGRRRRA